MSIYSYGSSGGYSNASQPQFPSQQAVPGTVTYTTSMGPDGQVIQHFFRAEAASYRSEQGIVPGIQWVPIGSSANEDIRRVAQPASMDWIQRWARGRNRPEDERQWREWMRMEEKRMKRLERDQREYEREQEKLIKRQRRSSFSAGLPVYSNYGYGSPQSLQPLQPALQGGYLAAGEPIIPGVNVSDNGSTGRRGSGSSRQSGRRVSFVGDRPQRYASVDDDPFEDDYQGTFTDSNNPYPPNHIMSLAAGRNNMASTMPLGTMASRSPAYGYSNLSAAGLNGGMMSSSPYNASQMQLAIPESFSRPPNTMPGYNQFPPMLIDHMDNIIIEIPPLPAALTAFDVNRHDWISFIQDLAQSWAGRLSVNGGMIKHRRSTMAANIIDTWNSAFFLPRYLEVVLVKGHTRYSGPTAGRIDPRLMRAVEDTLDDTSSSDSSDSDASEFYDDRNRGNGSYYGYEQGYGFYPSQNGAGIYGNNAWMNDTAMARREWRARRKDRNREKRRKDMERRARRENRFSLYVMCVS